jgi:hypothetical protein
MTSTSLEVPPQVGLGGAEEQQISLQWDTVESVIATAIKDGFTGIPQMPEYECPRLQPRKLGNLTALDFGVLIAAYDAWRSYCIGCLAIIDGQILQRENEMRIIGTNIRNGIRTYAQQNNQRKPAEAVIKDTVEGNPRWQQLLNELQQYQQHRHIVEAESKRLGSEKNSLSRSVEMRKIEAGLGDRD